MLGGELDDQFRERHRIARRISVHAYGLVQPGHMEWTLDGRLLISEFGGGRVFDITESGDCRDRTPFATGLQHPAGLVTTYEGGKILVADTGRNQIVDITDGGDIAHNPTILAEVPAPYGLTVYGEELFAVFSTDNQNGVVRVTNSLRFTEDDTYFGGFPNGNPEQPPYLPGSGACSTGWNAVAFGTRMLYSHSALGALYDVSTTGTFSFATPKFLGGLNRPLGMIYNPATELLYIAERGTGSIKAAPANGGVNMRFVPPVATGFRNPSCVRFSASGGEMYVCDMDDATVWKVEF